MDLGDIVPVFQLFFFYVLPSLIIILFLAILYKLFKKFAMRIKTLFSTLKQNTKKKTVAIKTFYELIDFLFMDAMVALVVILPMMLMIINFLSQNSIFMLQHFWDYTYPALFTIAAITALKIWINLLKRTKEVFAA